MKKVPLDYINLHKEFCACGSLMRLERELKKSRHYDDNMDYENEIYKILECPACENITVILYYRLGNFNEDCFLEDRDPYGLEPRSLHDRKLLYQPKKKINSEIPDTISEIIQQAESSLDNSPKASFILCRAVLEEICDYHNIPSKNNKNKGFLSLENRLKLLVEQEKISEDLVEVIKGIRRLGNIGTHTGYTEFSCLVKHEDAEILINLVNYVVKTLYTESEQQVAKKKLVLLKAKILKESEF